MTPEELIAYGRGYLDGYARGELHTMTQPLDPEEWRATVARWRAESERSLQRLMWDRAVQRGDNPTPHTEETTDGQAQPEQRAGDGRTAQGGAGGSGAP